MIRRTVRPRTNMLASSAAAVACLVERARAECGVSEIVSELLTF